MLPALMQTSTGSAKWGSTLTPIIRVEAFCGFCTTGTSRVRVLVGLGQADAAVARTTSSLTGWPTGCVCTTGPSCSGIVIGCPSAEVMTSPGWRYPGRAAEVPGWIVTIRAPLLGRLDFPSSPNAARVALRWL